MRRCRNYWISRKNNFHFSPAKPDIRLTGTTFSLGIPSFISELASGIVIIVFNFIILGIRGNLGVAAYGVVTNISLVVTSMFTGIAQGLQPVREMIARRMALFGSEQRY